MARRRLRAPAGTDECNFGGERMPIGDDGTVSVPDEAVASLLATGGFSTTEDAPVVPEGFVLATNPSGVEGVSWGGKTYEPCEKGIFTVPASSMLDLMDHGFVPAPGSAAVDPNADDPIDAEPPTGAATPLSTLTLP